LILLDLGLPRKDGREVLEEVKQDEHLRAIPVVVITTSRAQEDVEQSYRDHANAFVSKPVDFPNFARMMQSLERFWFAVVTLPSPGATVGQPRLAEAARTCDEDLRQARAEREQAAAEFSQLLHAISHDLREPVRGVAATTELLRERCAGQLDAKADELLRHAAENAERLEEMLNGLLALSRVEARGGPLAPTSAGECLDDAIARLARQINASSAEITRGALPTVTADRAQLTTVFEELLSNAIEFRRQDAPPRIHVGAEREDGAWVFSVRDEGIGIDPRYAKRIFGVFQRLHTRNEHPGTGIGLALCKRIVERHGGMIDVRSQPGQGSVFRFCIPDGD